VSVLPSFFGEKIVLRVLDKNQAVLDIEKLGFEPLTPIEVGIPRFVQWYLNYHRLPRR